MNLDFPFIPSFLAKKKKKGKKEDTIHQKREKTGKIHSTVAFGKLCKAENH